MSEITSTICARKWLGDLCGCRHCNPPPADACPSCGCTDYNTRNSATTKFCKGCGEAVEK